MELRGRIMTGNLLIVILILQFPASFQQESFSYSFSAFSSSVSYASFMNRRPCVFRGELMLHKQIREIDSCTECTCNNGTTTCTVESCPPDPGCEESERVISPQECCPSCPGAQNNNKHELDCFFRGDVILKGKSLQLDPCTECTCRNGTTVCVISSCPPLHGCSPKYTFIDPEECCPRCQSIATVKSLSWKQNELKRSSYGKETPIRLDVRIEFKESEILEGVGMWRVGIFGSSDSAGVSQRHYEVYQTLNEDQASTAKTGTLMKIRNIRSDFQVGSIGCARARYFCLEFAKGDEPYPPFILRFDNDSKDSPSKSLISCKKMKCSKRKSRQKVR